MLGEGKLKHTAVVVRSYKNSHVTQQIRNLLNMGVGKIYVVVKNTEDKGSTKGWLKKYKNDPRLEVFEMEDGYTWCNALNAAIYKIQMENLSERSTVEFVLNLSVETKITKKHLVTMLDVLTDSQRVGVVGSSFVGYCQGNQVSLGRSYRHPRNTGMVIRFEVFKKLLGLFNNLCDDKGGMEDIEFILRMLVYTNYEYRMLNLGIKLVVGVYYNQDTKEQREQSAMDLIIQMWRNTFPNKDSEGRLRFENAIAEMGLEEA